MGSRNPLNDVLMRTAVPVARPKAFSSFRKRSRGVTYGVNSYRCSNLWTKTGELAGVLHCVLALHEGR